MNKCLSCDGVLTNEEEGLCPFCGTPFGAQTMVMPVLTREQIEQVEQSSKGSGDGEAGEEDADADADADAGGEAEEDEG